MTILPKKTRTKEHRLHRQQQQQQQQHAESSGSSSSARIATASTAADSSAPPTRRQRLSGQAAGVSAANSLNCSPVGSPSCVAAVQKEPAGPTSSGTHKRHQPTGDYNSDDENAKRAAEDNDLERRFEQHLTKAKGYRIKRMQGDGACLFRAVADQIYGDEEMHDTVRSMCLDYMTKNRDHFSQFITEDFNEYIARKRLPTTHGNHPEMQAIAEMFNRPIHVYEYSIEPINTFQPETSRDNPPLRVSYHNGTHYNSIVDPHNATVGVGLGLPQFHPGLADKNLMRDATVMSEQQDIEEQMFKDKIKATDWEATQEQMTEQAARESYFEWLREQERFRGADKQPRSPKASSATNNKSGPTSPSPSAAAACASARASTPPQSSSSSTQTSSSSVSDERGSSFLADHTAAFATGDFANDDDLLKHVLALSQQEFYESQRGQGPSTSKP